MGLPLGGLIFVFYQITVSVQRSRNGKYIHSNFIYLVDKNNNLLSVNLQMKEIF